MDTQLTTHNTKKKEIIFPNGNRAQLVAPLATSKAVDIMDTLGVKQPKALIIVTGGAVGLDEALKSRLAQLFSRGIARAAATTEALILDGGTQAGVMALMGQGVADRGRKSILLGVAPAGRVTYPGGPAEGSIEDGAPLDPNHSHFVLVKSDEWGGETDTMFEVAKVLAKGIPVVTILANGGATAKDEVLRSVQQGWPVLVIEGSGRLADEIATLWKKKPPFIEDWMMAEIIADGDIHLLPLDGDDSIAKVDRLIIDQLKKHMVLRLAWERFALYDANAIRQQKGFNRLELWILVLGLLGTLLALIQTTLRTQGFNLIRLDQALHYAIVVVPITIAALVAAANRFKAGGKWILLRASAEAIKREIYRYRARAGIYSQQRTPQTSPESELAQKLDPISRQLMQTDVNLSALRPYEGSIPPKMYGAAAADNGFSFLMPSQYISIRLGDQLNYYQKKTNKLERQFKLLHWLIYIFGGVGTLLAAIGLELWIALTIALVGALTTFLEYRQVENTLIIYNQAVTDLANVKAWWMALSAREQAEQRNVDKLVDYTEKILEGEHTGWVQSMKDALAELRKESSEGRS